MELALRRAEAWHRGLRRRGADTPYLLHPVAVAMILLGHGFGENVAIAGLLHDVLEDTDATRDDLLRDFGAEVADLVAACSEVKADASGRKRSWSDRKRDHVALLASASSDARAVALADKLHNLASIRHDLGAGVPIWGLFHASRACVLDYYRECIARFSADDARLAPLAEECRLALEAVETGPS